MVTIIKSSHSPNRTVPRILTSSKKFEILLVFWLPVIQFIIEASSIGGDKFKRPNELRGRTIREGDRFGLNIMHGMIN